MAEFFTPSTTGEGQGAAQIFQSNPQFADASGIVRGIERGEARMAANQQKEYERQKEEARQNRERLNELYKLQTAGNNRKLNAMSKSVIDNFKTSFINGEGDIDDLYGEARGELLQISELDKTIGTIAKDVAENPSNFQTLTENGYVSGSLDILEAVKTGKLPDAPISEQLAELQDKVQTFGSSPNNILSTGFSLEDIYLADRKKADEAKETTETLTDEGGIKTTEKSIPQNKKERRDALLANQIAIQSELNRLRREYNVGTIEEVEKAIGMPFPQYFKQRVDELVDKEDVVNIKEKLPKGGKGITEQVNVKGTDVRREGEGYEKTDIDEIGINVLKEGSKTTEQPVTVSVGNKQRNGFIKAVTKDAEGNVLVKVEWKEDGQVKSDIYPVDEVREYLTEAQINEIQAKGGDVNISTSYDLDTYIDELISGFTANQDIALDLVKFIPNATNITDPENNAEDIAFTLGETSYSLNLEDDKDLSTFKELVKNNSGKVEDDALYYLLDGSRIEIDDINSKIYGGVVPAGAIKVTKENQAVEEANRPDRAKEKEGGRPPLSSFAKPKK